MKTPNPSIDLSFQFALNVIEYVETLEENKSTFCQNNC
jgi:hypothetical protein